MGVSLAMLGTAAALLLFGLLVNVVIRRSAATAGRSLLVSEGVSGLLILAGLTALAVGLVFRVAH